MNRSWLDSKLHVGTKLNFQMFYVYVRDRGDLVSTMDTNSDCLSRESVRLCCLYPGQSCMSWGKSLVEVATMQDQRWVCDRFATVLGLV